MLYFCYHIHKLHALFWFIELTFGQQIIYNNIIGRQNYSGTLIKIDRSEHLYLYLIIMFVDIVES